MIKKKRIIVVGGGFAGLNVIRKLDPRLFDIILIDKINHHQFQPLFYQVASSQLEPSSISFPFRFIFRNYKDIQIRLASATRVHPEKSILSTSIGDLAYDYLVLAMGCTTNFFGNNEIKKHAFTLKTTYDAINIRNHILQTFEDIITSPEKEKVALNNIVIVGAGPTGVELSGAFAEIKKNILPRDFHRIDFSRLKIILIEGSDHSLNAMSHKSKRDSAKYMDRLGVELLTDTIVTSYDGKVLKTNTGKEIKTKTVIWAAGVISNELEGIPEAVIEKGQRIKVDRYNRIDTGDNIFVLGDMAHMETDKYPTGHPQLANVAINQAKNLARNLKRMEKGKALKVYEYKDRGTMATIGRNKSVVDFPFMHLRGITAWLIWMFLHLMLILSVRNKLIIFINWAWTYVSRNTALRIILKEPK